MRFRLLRILLPLGAVTAAALVGCGDIERFPSTSLTVKPDPITDAALTLDRSDGSVVLTWTAPRTHGGTDGLRRYDLRYDYSGDFEWSTAERVASPPVPVEAGRLQTYRFTYPSSGRVLSASIRAIDNSGNFSDAGNVAALLVPGITLSGVSVDCLTGDAADVTVTLTTSELTRTVRPDETGHWIFPDLPESALSLRIVGAGETPSVFPVEIAMTLTENTDLDIRMIPYRQGIVHPSLSMLGLFKQVVGLYGENTVLHTWPARPVGVYIPEYVTAGGLDYRAVAIDALSRWNEMTEIVLFHVVATPPESGVNMGFLPPAEMASQIGYTSHVNTPEGTPLHSDIAIVNTIEDPASLRRVMLHELGHTIRLSHLPVRFLMYSGQPLPDDPTADEIWFVRVLNALPDGTDVKLYREVGE